MICEEKGELNSWEAASARFETPQEEIATFTRRLLSLPAAEWPRDAAVVPWLTPSLRLVHFLSSRRLMRRCFSKLDAFATMVEHESQTYEQWQRQPEGILSLFRDCFEVGLCFVAWGKLSFVGRKKGKGR